jgi:hypothetical protein
VSPLLPPFVSLPFACRAPPPNWLTAPPSHTSLKNKCLRPLQALRTAAGAGLPDCSYICKLYHYSDAPDLASKFLSLGGFEVLCLLQRLSLMFKDSEMLGGPTERAPVLRLTEQALDSLLQRSPSDRGGEVESNLASVIGELRTAVSGLPRDNEWVAATADKVLNKLKGSGY